MIEYILGLILSGGICVMAGFVILVVVILRIAINSKQDSSYQEENQEKEHRHSWKHDHKRSTIEIPEHKSDSETDKKLLKMGILPSHHYGIFHNVYTCNECGEEKKETRRSLY